MSLCLTTRNQNLQGCFLCAEGVHDKVYRHKNQNMNIILLGFVNYKSVQKRSNNLIKYHNEHKNHFFEMFKSQNYRIPYIQWVVNK